MPDQSFREVNCIVICAASGCTFLSWRDGYLRSYSEKYITETPVPHRRYSQVFPRLSTGADGVCDRSPQGVACRDQPQNHDLGTGCSGFAILASRHGRQYQPKRSVVIRNRTRTAMWRPDRGPVCQPSRPLSNRVDSRNRQRREDTSRDSPPGSGRLSVGRGTTADECALAESHAGSHVRCLNRSISVNSATASTALAKAAPSSRVQLHCSESRTKPRATRKYTIS